MTGGKTKTDNTVALKAKYLKCFGAGVNAAPTLREVIKELMDEGVPRPTLIRWAVQAGCTQSYASTLVSRVLCALGLRERRAGAGRKTSPAVLELLAHARSKYGKNYLKVLRAAWRTGKAPKVAKLQNGGASKLKRGPQLPRQDTNYGPMLRRLVRPSAEILGNSGKIPPRNLHR